MRVFIKILSACIFAGAGLLTVLYWIAPTGPRDPEAFADWRDPQGERRAALRSDGELIVAGTPWAAAAGRDMLAAGGTACDAAVTAVLMLNVTFSEAASFPGVAPALVYDARTKKIRSYIGAGKAPAKATIELFRERGYEDAVPKNSILAQLVPASPDVLTALLADCGTRSFSAVVAPAIKTAREGFPVHRTMLGNFDMPLYKRFGFSLILPYNARVFLGGEWWRPLHHKDRFQLPDLANTFEELAAAERAAYANPAAGFAGEAERLAGLSAVREYFYAGPIAQKIVAFHQSEGGLLSREDLAGYTAGFEAPLAVDVGEFRLHTNQTWTQGIVVLQALKILEGLDLRELGHNSPEYIHTVAQAIELAMADREEYAGDPEFVQVPARRLLSAGYAAERRELMTPGQAFGETPPPGNARTAATGSFRARFITPPGRRGNGATTESDLNAGRNETKPVPTAAPLAIDFGPDRGQAGRDTSYVAVVDRNGNSVSITPSDFPLSPMVPATGLTLGIRMTQFRLDPNHPSALAPGKRPRITPHALMVERRGRFYMSFGTPGGEMQTQALVQVFLNHTAFGMDIQKAIEAPRFRSRNWPDAFSPHEYLPGVLEIETSLEGARETLEAFGYTVESYPDFDNHFSAVGAIVR
ncbi:MAG: gamma-glutamyltransferase, partial [Leptospirales bacterium]